MAGTPSTNFSSASGRYEPRRNASTRSVRDLFTLSVDYRDDPEAAGLFFAEVQNKMLYAVTQHTAAEIVVQRADPGQPNIALTAWKSGRVRKDDVVTAKNSTSLKLRESVWTMCYSMSCAISESTITASDFSVCWMPKCQAGERPRKDWTTSLRPC